MRLRDWSLKDYLKKYNVMVRKTLIIFVSVFVFFLLLSTQNERIHNREIILKLNQEYIENLSANIDLNDSETVFSYILSQLDDNVNVYPTENYYYFSFNANGKEIWGNIRLPQGERERGILSFAYWEFTNFPQQLNDPNFFSVSKKLGPTDGLSVVKVSSFEYRVSFKRKAVVFHLNQIEQKLPQSIKLRKREVFVMRTFDESGLGFFLVFNKDTSDFMWLLDEANCVPIDYIYLDNDFILEKRTQFVFYWDKKRKRKVLVGVYAENIKKNNYFDGPFDQLADNYIDEATKLKEYINQTYPYASGRVNEYGEFIDTYGKTTDVRIALTPYYNYYTMDDLLSFIEYCPSYQQEEEFYSYLVYDYKKSIPR